MDWRDAIGGAKDFASGAIDAIRANDTNGKRSCKNCGTYLGGGGDIGSECPYCGKEF